MVYQGSAGRHGRAWGTNNNVKKYQIALLSIAALGTLGWLVDTGISTTFEPRLSTQLEDSFNLSVEPAVYIGGFPYLLAAATGDIPMMSSEVLDVDVPGFGMMNSRTELRTIEVTPEQVFSGDYTGADVEIAKRTLRLDGVALGAQLGITDLDITNPKDISPQASPQAQAQLKGTPVGFDQPVVVLVDLRIHDAEITMRPVSIIDSPDMEQAQDPESVRTKIMNSFTWSVDSRDLPLLKQASQVVCGGGSIFISSELRQVQFRPELLSPVGVR